MFLLLLSYMYVCYFSLYESCVDIIDKIYLLSSLRTSHILERFVLSFERKNIYNQSYHLLVNRFIGNKEERNMYFSKKMDLEGLITLLIHSGFFVFSVFLSVDYCLLIYYPFGRKNYLSENVLIYEWLYKTMLRRYIIYE